MMNMNNTNSSSKYNIITLTIGALGVVFGDIGTSPLYALRECFLGSHAFSITVINILGAVSLIFWSLILIISIKYIIFVMRADNHGEGGILALMTLVTRSKKSSRKFHQFFILLGIFGAALLYGDSIITPAISVLSAIEGLNVATDVFKPYIVPLSILIIIMLFTFQYKGTTTVGAIFGPIMLLWFITIAILGGISIIRQPHILQAINPFYAINFFMYHGWYGFTILGVVFLAMTGGEAIYADIGHFGKTPIRHGWFFIVLPCLVINYFGQGAHLLQNPQEIENLFYRLAPSWFLYPMVMLSTIATVIASQAVISGAFSLTRQAVQLGYLPRLEIIHTSDKKIGQVYIPSVNTWLLIGTLLLILVFKHSSNLATAYGIAVSATMLITTILISVVAKRRWNIKLPIVLVLGSFFILIELAFFSSNVIKFMTGGWIPILIALVISEIIFIWKNGRKTLRKRIESETLDENIFLQDIAQYKPIRVPGVAVFLTPNMSGVPRTLLHNFKHNKILHEHTVFLSVKTEKIPHIPEEERFRVDDLGQGIYRIIVKFGFSEDPNISKVLKCIQTDKLRFDPMKTTFFLGRETLLISRETVASRWKKKIFTFLSHNAFDATQFFRIPPNSVIELGIQVQV